jgi:hypothetical protein
MRITDGFQELDCKYLIADRHEPPEVCPQNSNVSLTEQGRCSGHRRPEHERNINFCFRIFYLQGVREQGQGSAEQQLLSIL